MPALVNSLRQMTPALLYGDYLASAGTVNGTGMDISSYDGQILITLCGSVTSIANTLAVTIEHADDVSFAVNKSTVGTFATITGTAVQALTANYRGFYQAIPLDTNALRRYLRVVLVQTGASGTWGVAVTIQGAQQVV